MLETLLTAVESESQLIDIARVSGFMQKVCLPLPTDKLYAQGWKQFRFAMV